MNLYVFTELLGFYILLDCTLIAVDCCNMVGDWQNELGDTLTITQHTPDGWLIGHYTQISGRISNQKSGMLVVYGAMPFNKTDAMFGMSLTSKDGKKTFIWTGQCFVTNTSTVLLTSWLERDVMTSCDDRLHSTSIGMHEFTLQKGSQATDTHSQETFRLGKSKTKQTWYNDLGSELILHNYSNSDGYLQGEYRTAVERSHGAAGVSHSQVFGQSSRSSSMVTLFVVWQGGRSITAWTGQFHHMCPGDHGNATVLDTSWILRAGITSQRDEWKSTHFGQDLFTQHEQVAGPRKSSGTHGPSRGPQKLSCLPPSVLSAPAFVVCLVLVIVLTLILAAVLTYMCRHHRNCRQGGALWMRMNQDL